MATDVGSAATVEPAEPSTRAERVGWYFYDWANSAFYTTGIAVFLAPYLTGIAENAAGCGTDANPCDVERLHPLGIPVAPGSFYAYCLALSVLLQVLVLPVVGAIADRSPHKRRLLAVFAYTGSIATMGFLFLTGDRYLLGGALFIVANIAFGASIVVYNSFLPYLAGPDDRDRVSSIGWALGYIGGGVLLAINLAALFVAGDDNAALIARWSLVSAGVWWAAFTTLPLARLRDRPAPAGEARGAVLTDGFRQLGRTLRGLKAYPLSLFFLIAFLVYNDGIQTVIGTASLYADSYLRLDEAVRAETILLVQFTAFGGALLLGWLARRFGAWKTVLASLVLWIIVLGVAYVLPVGQVLPFMALGVGLGIVLGGSQALSRSLFSQLIPKGKEGEYFGLYEISDKGTSWLGPLLFGLTYQATGNYQVAIVSIMSFFVIGFIALLAIPMRRAIIAAGNEPPRVL
jgi:MFS transporter, UMF1 family